jgi:hypothetical protein
LISCRIVILSKAKDLLFYRQLEAPRTPNKCGVLLTQETRAHKTIVPTLLAGFSVAVPRIRELPLQLTNENIVQSTVKGDLPGTSDPAGKILC